ncbi:hypothetical protein [Polycladidibacter hongkongensis]|uniref:type III secretion apparatus assembly protein SctX n=1 Tax=Polycladidibacter hongkongensis TaxID=1647556 RepID=UPI0008304746|nr:hypothetical protein [Pseudovibrio hongkongensis]
MRVASITIGVDEVSTWRMEERVRLPEGKRLNPVFLPEARALDSILHRPTLAERLPALLLPKFSDTDILQPAELSELRQQMQRVFLTASYRADEEKRKKLKACADLLRNEVILDEELQEALAMLLQG